MASQGWYQVQNSSDNNVTQTITLVMAMPLGSTTNVNKHVILCEISMIPQLNSCIFQVTKTLGQDVLDHDAKALLSPPSPTILQEHQKSMTTLSSSSSSIKASSTEHHLLFAN